MTKEQEVLCNIFNCGDDDLSILLDSQIDFNSIIAECGSSDFRDVVGRAFENKVVKEFGFEKYEQDFDIDTNFSCTTIYIRNREKYDKDKIKEIEDYMGLEFEDME